MGIQNCAKIKGLVTIGADKLNLLKKGPTRGRFILQKPIQGITFEAVLS